VKHGLDGRGRLRTSHRCRPQPRRHLRSSSPVLGAIPVVEVRERYRARCPAVALKSTVDIPGLRPGPRRAHRPQTRSSPKVMACSRARQGPCLYSSRSRGSARRVPYGCESQRSALGTSSAKHPGSRAHSTLTDLGHGDLVDKDVIDFDMRFAEARAPAGPPAKVLRAQHASRSG